MALGGGRALHSPVEGTVRPARIQTDSHLKDMAEKKDLVFLCEMDISGKHWLGRVSSRLRG